jgi:ParB-like chromosome segregation protein Spo0J
METLSAAGEVKAAFEITPVILGLDELHTTRPLPTTATSSRKFLQILASIATVGLVEPLVVVRADNEVSPYRVLDGRLRLEALRRLGISDVTCLIATDDEPYTYNKHINRLTPAQDARMISRVIEQGVSRDRIASVLGVDAETVQRRARLLDGICPEAASLLGDKVCPGTTFATLKQMMPVRQIEAAELMCGQGNFSSTFAKAILAATPDAQLRASPSPSTRMEGDVAAQLARLESELASLQANAVHIDQQYGIDHLHLAVSTTYVARLMSNETVSSWLSDRYPEIAAQFQSIAKEGENHHGSRSPQKARFRRKPQVIARAR